MSAEELQEQKDEATPDLTDDALALELGERWRNHARYVSAWNRWYFYDRRVWRADDALWHMTGARKFLRRKATQLEKWAARQKEKAEEIEDPARKKEALKEAEDAAKWAASKAARLRMAPTVAAVVNLAQSNPHQAATVTQWDADPWLLGTPNGTVDLRSGELRPARHDDFITKATAVVPAAPGTAAPLWSETLRRIAGEDEDLIAYLRRFFGYSLTGSIREHTFAFGYGTGANGKGTVLNTIKAIMSDYAAVIPTEMLMVSQNERHPTELARLRGIRLAIGSETEQGKRWAESRIKSLTGGDPIAARFMRADFFEFEPTFKLFVVGNHRPALRGVDEAMRRRLHFVPFTVTIPPEDRDPDLSEKLRAEWPAILRWAIDGCLEWQRDGLKPPAAIHAATEEYFEDEDAFGTWLAECTEPDANAWESSKRLFSSWKQWAEAAGEFVGTRRRFAHQLEERGLVEQRATGGVRGYRGASLKEVAETTSGAWSNGY